MYRKCLPIIRLRVYPWRLVTSPFTVQPLGGASQPLRDAPRSSRVRPVPFTLRPCPRHFSFCLCPRGALIINKALSDTCRNRPACSRRKSSRGFLNVTVNCDICAEPAPGHEIPKLTSFDVSLFPPPSSSVIYSRLDEGKTRRMFKLFVEGGTVAIRIDGDWIELCCSGL